MSESETENTEPVTPTNEETKRAALQSALTDYVQALSETIVDAQPSAGVATVDLNDESFLALLAKMKQDNDDGGAVSEMIVSTIRAYISNGNVDLDDLDVDSNISDWMSNYFDIDDHICAYDLAERVEQNLDMDNIASEAAEHINIHDQVGQSLLEFMVNGCGDVETAVGRGVERTLLMEQGTLRDRRREGTTSVILTQGQFDRIMSVVDAIAPLQEPVVVETQVEVEKIVEVGTPRAMTTEEHAVEIIRVIGTDEAALRDLIPKAIALRGEQDAQAAQIVEGVEEETQEESE
tara:strand:+ start:3780 stop:4658 length:879 start_codon:yes stop_codon:yes gene_type:complete